MSTTTASSSASRSLLWRFKGALLLFVAFLAFIPVQIVTMLRVADAPGHLMVAPGVGVFDVTSSGTHRIWLQNQRQEGGHWVAYATDWPAGWSVTVHGPASADASSGGPPVPVTLSSMNLRVSAGSLQRFGLAQVTLPTPGRYAVTVQPVDAGSAGPSRLLYLAPDHFMKLTKMALAFGLLTAALFFGSVALFVRTLIHSVRSGQVD